MSQLGCSSSSSGVMRRSGSESSVDDASSSLAGEIGRLLFVLACLMACFAAGVVAYLRLP